MGITLMLVGAALAHSNLGVHPVIQDAFAYFVHGLGFERLISLIPE